MKLSKRLTAMLLLAVMTLPLIIVSASAASPVSVTADAVNPTAREAGQLVVYTPDFGATTGTNDWGVEVVVENDKAVKIVRKGNNSIPKNGFVLSGHDENAGDESRNKGKWLEANVKVGSYVYCNPAGVITISDTEIAENAFYSFEKTFTAVNGTRGENMTIIYNKIGTKTGTNEWGYEIVCTAGIVTSLGGFNNTIPNQKGSFVVSVHGDQVIWYQDNVKLGMSVTYNEATKKVTFSYDDSAAVSGVRMKFNELKANYESAIKRYDNFDHASVKADLDAFEADVNKLEKDYKSKKISTSELVASCKQLEEKAAEITLKTCESRTVEYRGVWLRPTDKSEASVAETVQKLYDNGINMICIETIYDCTTIMPMPEGCLFECNPKFDHFDMLKTYIDECHKREMELHLWLPIFYVGDYYSKNVRRSVGIKKPEWLSVSNTGKYSYQLLEQGKEGAGLMMLDPANREATDYLLNTYKYILETYDVDGLELDYIRYYTRSADGSYDMGYNEAILDAFEEKYGVRPQYNTKASYWANWVAFRCQYVTDFVERMRKLIDEVSPDVLLGADVAPDPAEASGYNYQDYYTWLSKGWIDILHPMSYGYGYEEAIAEQVKKCGDNAYIAVGLGIFMSEMGEVDMQNQAVYNNSVAADGSVYFEATAYLNKGAGEYLLKGVYRNRAITPTFDTMKAAKAQIEACKDRINNVIVPLGGISEEGAKTVIAELDKLSASFTDKGYDKSVYDGLNELLINSNMMSDAAARVKDDVRLALKCYNIDGKVSDTSNAPELPGVDIGDVSKGDDNASDTESSADDSSSDVSGATDNEGTPSWVWAVVVAVVVIIAAVVVAIVILKKKD